MADRIAFFLIMCAAIPATAFPAFYAFRPWWRSLVGWALMFQSVGMMLLVDISLAYQVFGNEYPGRDVVRLGVYVLLVTGLWVLFVALLRDIHRDRSR